MNFLACRGHSPIQLEVLPDKPYTISEKPTKKILDLFLNYLHTLKSESIFYPLIRPGASLENYSTTVRLDNENKFMNAPFFNLQLQKNRIAKNQFSSMKTTIAHVAIEKKLAEIPTEFVGNHEHHCQACIAKVVNAFEIALKLSFESSLNPTYDKNKKMQGMSYLVLLKEESKEIPLQEETFLPIKLGKRRK